MTRPISRDVKVTVKQVIEHTSLSRTAAYELMHDLGAVRVGRGRRSLRLPSSVFERYLAQLTAASVRDRKLDSAPSNTPLLESALRRGRKLRTARQSPSS